MQRQRAVVLDGRDPLTIPGTVREFWHSRMSSRRSVVFSSHNGMDGLKKHMSRAVSFGTSERAPSFTRPPSFVFGMESERTHREAYHRTPELG